MISVAGTPSGRPLASFISRFISSIRSLLTPSKDTTRASAMEASLSVQGNPTPSATARPCLLGPSRRGLTWRSSKCASSRSSCRRASPLPATTCRETHARGVGPAAARAPGSEGARGSRPRASPAQTGARDQPRASAGALPRPPRSPGRTNRVQRRASGILEHGRASSRTHRQEPPLARAYLRRRTQPARLRGWSQPPLRYKPHLAKRLQRPQLSRSRRDGSRSRGGIR
jgi:hypothetical protein